jgi:nucleotide-binding universal stress UspA family protein
MDLKDSELREVLKASQPEESWTHEVVMGRTAEVLTSVAEHRGADLIVVGRTRHGPLDRVFGGETTLQVMRTSAVSVLAVAAELDHPRTIVVATDFFPASVQAAKVALRLLGKAGTLYIAYVGPPLDLLPNGFTLPGETRFPGDVVVCFRRLIDGLGGHSGVLVEPITLTGKPVSAILEFAERVGADVIAAGSHSHSRMERVLLGSVSTGLVRDAHCAVLVAPACD